jgi:hypothetical protein
MTKLTTLQVLSIQCRLFESMNVVVRRHYLQTSAVFSQLLQPIVMHNFGQIASGHVSPFFIIELLQKNRKEISSKCEMSQHR